MLWKCVIIMVHVENLDSGVMCPSYRVTKEEKDLVRGRANTLRLALIKSIT